MSRRTIVASFGTEQDLLDAVRGIRKRHWEIVDVYTPYVVHGLEQEIGWRRSRLPVACFLGGAAGLGLALWFQFWATATDWPLNVGGRPWNSLPAFVPVAFECMVLLGGFSLVFAWLFRCQLYPGKKAALALPGLTNDRFAVAIRAPDADAGLETAQELLHRCHAVDLEERDEEEPQR